VLYKNIRVEFSSDQLPEILQTSEAQTYDTGEKTATPYLINVDNTPYNLRVKSSEAVKRALPEKLGVIKNIRFENIQSFTDSDEIKPLIRVHCEGEKANISDITICDLYLNAKKQTDLSDFDLRLENFDKVNLK
jgi:hypothetical protein